MKFSWGTGILIFLILFVTASAAFIVFAMRQDVNLVHEDYYEKGVDYSQQMDVNTRSFDFKDAVQACTNDKSLIVEFDTTLAASIDSGNLLLYRPSDSKLDLNMSFKHVGSPMSISNTDLYPGRYILKISWYSKGLKYQVDKTINIQ